MIPEKIWLSSPHMGGNEQHYVKEAFDNTISAMKGTMGDYTIPAISESPILDVFPYFSGEEGELEQLERFNALKASKPESATEIEDDMEFSIEEEEVVS